MQNSPQVGTENNQEIRVEAGVTSVCCRGTGDALGHPAVYLTFSDQDRVQCYYCGRIYVRAQQK